MRAATTIWTRRFCCRQAPDPQGLVVRVRATGIREALDPDLECRVLLHERHNVLDLADLVPSHIRLVEVEVNIPEGPAGLGIGPWSNSRTESDRLRSGIMASGFRPDSWPVRGVLVPRRGGAVPLKGTDESAKFSNVLNCRSGTSVASVKRHPEATIQRPKTGE